MKIGLAILIAIHALIHLFGFFKAFGIAEFSAITHPVSKTFGAVWLLTFLLFAITLAFMFFYLEYWWTTGFAAIVLSQFLIFKFWSDAKFGTIANIVILGAAIIAYSTHQFTKKVNGERSQIFAESIKTDRAKITAEMISHLPQAVQNWLIYSGAVGKELIENVYLTQGLQLKMKETQKEWNFAAADQYFTVQPPAFNWKINMQLNSMINIVGRDKLEYGCGEMFIKMFSLIPIADAKHSTKVNEATLQRYLAEIVWFPTAALSPYIKWEPIDDQSARATINHNGTEGSGIFHFDEKGEFTKFTALRFKDINDSEPILWTVNAIKTDERNGIKIPIECEAKWKLENEDWTWLRLKITNIDYNVKNAVVSK